MHVDPLALRLDGAMVPFATFACIGAVVPGTAERWTDAVLVGLLVAIGTSMLRHSC